MSDSQEFKQLSAKVLAGSASVKEYLQWKQLKKVHLESYENGSGQGRRRFHRATVPVEVSFNSRAELIKSFSYDIGAGGIRLKLDNTYSVGDVHELSLLLPGNKEPISIASRVAWIGKDNMVGFEFLFVPEDVQDKIDALVCEEIDVSDL